MRQIEMQRRDRNVTILDGFEVGSFAGMPCRWIAADPVVLPAPRIEPLDDSLGIDALSEPRDFYALKISDRKIHIENDLRIARALEYVPREPCREFCASRERKILADECRKRDRGNVEQGPFEGRRDRAGVSNVVAEVGAEVD